MQTISFKTYIGEDGILQISLPEHLKNTDLEITLVYQPILASKNKKNDLSTGWAKEFFEEVIGGWEGEELVREKQLQLSINN
ncbi:hypothetical protein [Geminocystis sp.]|uniref:hypothetical protein n=1 Tax=Geminocystis sp. TaxID=2664100 RepID=UPI00359339BD